MQYRSRISLVAAAMLGGCSSVGNVLYPDEDNSLSGAGTIVRSSFDSSTSASQGGMEVIDLPKLLMAYDLSSPKDIASALTSKASELQYKRNDMQDRIIAASNQRCATYMRSLVDSRALTQMNWTALSALLSGAASVVTHADLAKALSAGSTASTGIVGAYNQAYFNNLTVNVIAAGIKKQREAIFQNILASRSKPLMDYPVQAAVSDAIAYHAACNIVVGMATATEQTQVSKVSDLQANAPANRASGASAASAASAPSSVPSAPISH